MAYNVLARNHPLLREWQRYAMPVGVTCLLGLMHWDRRDWDGASIPLDHGREMMIHLFDLEVPPVMQGRGIARAIIKELCRLLDEHQINCSLRCWPHSGYGWVQDIYERSGWKMADPTAQIMVREFQHPVIEG